MAGVFGRKVREASIDVGELMGWRFWRVHFKNLELQSYSQDYTWKPGVNEASGLPSEDSMHGFYAFKKPDPVLEYAHGIHLFCLGIVDMWGDVIEGELGYRSQYASIYNITTLVYPENRIPYYSLLQNRFIYPKQKFITDCDTLDQLRLAYGLEHHA